MKVQGANIALVTTLVIAIGAAIGLGAQVGGTSEPDAARSTASLPHLADLQVLAQDACLCAMAGGKDCSTRYKEITAPLTKEGFGSASFPIASSVICFPQLGGDECVAERYELVSGSSSDFVCTNDQVEILDRLFEDVGYGPNGETADAVRAMQAKIRLMREEVGRLRAAESTVTR